jgi:hypothetical protein
MMYHSVMGSNIIINLIVDIIIDPGLTYVKRNVVQRRFMMHVFLSSALVGDEW